MTPFDLIVILGGVCGTLMTLGGLLLLSRDSLILLKVAPRRRGTLSGIKLEFQGLKVSTDYPAVGLFVIGLAFLGGSAWFARPAEVEPLQIRGQVRSADPSVKIYVTTTKWSVDRQTDGHVRGTVYPNLEDLRVVVVAPGHEPAEVEVFVEASRPWLIGSARVANLGVIDLGGVVLEKPAVDPAKVQDPRKPLPGPEQPGRF